MYVHARRLTLKQVNKLTPDHLDDDVGYCNAKRPSGGGRVKLCRADGVCQREHRVTHLIPKTERIGGGFDVAALSHKERIIPDLAHPGNRI